MAIENVYFRSGALMDWRWPLRVGLYGKPDDIDIFLKGLVYPSQFYSISQDIKGKAFDIVIVLDFSMRDVRGLNELHFNANVILLHTSQVPPANPLLAGNTFAKIAQNKRCAGIFIFSTGIERTFRFDTLIRDLSNDIDFVTALRQTVTDGYFFYDVNLEIETRISFVVENLKWTLKTRKFGKHYLEEPGDPYAFPADPNLLIQWTKLVYEELDRTISRHRKIGESGESPFIPDVPRYLQAQILSFEQKEQVRYFLRFKTMYLLRIRIGLEDKEWTSANRGFPDAKVFEIDTSLREKVLIVFVYGKEAVVQLKELELPRFGNSNEIDFPFATTEAGDQFTGDIYAYHKGRMLQKVSIEMPYENNAGNGLQLKESFIARSELNNLDTRIQFASSLFFDSQSAAKEKLSGLIAGEPIHLNLDDALKELLEDIRDKIEDTIAEVEEDGQTPKAKEDINDPYNVALLIDLALMGNQLYVDHLKRKELTGPLQIVTSRNEFVPLDFVYTFPAPSEQATLCPDAPEALKNGACKGCLNGKKAPAPHVCPFGFLGISHIIERHTTESPTEVKADYMIKAEPSAGRNVLTILKNTLYASSNRVAALTPDLENDIAACLNLHTKYSRVATWDEWKNAIEKDEPDTQIMLVHVESAERRKIRLEIGDELILQNYFEPSTIKPAVEAQSPLMIVIGCETTNVENYAFDISNRLINCGAAIVLSNFTKIRGRHAGMILMTLVELLSADPGKEKFLGEIIVRLKQLLLAKGIMASLALVALGDADWKIKK